MSSTPVGLDLGSFARWAEESLPALLPPFSGELIAGGQSNITARLTDSRGRAFIVRRPPLHSVLPTAHDMAREYTVLSALGSTSVPVPHVLAYCESAEVIGAPFYVMSFVDGVVLNDADTAASALTEAARARAGESLVDALVALHDVDVMQVGLEHFGRPDAFIERQLRRWHAQLVATESRTAGALDRVHDALTARIPDQVEATIVHGDYRLGNTILDQQGGVRAILDWEISTIGDPRADVGYLIATWAEPADELSTDERNPTLTPGFASRASLLDRYAEASGRDVADINYFIAFSLWRLACIYEGVVTRLAAGARGDTGADIERFRRSIDACTALAEEAIAWGP